MRSSIAFLNTSRLKAAESGLWLRKSMRSHIGIMNLDDLEIFIDVAVQGSFSKAAAIHELAQPTITLRIQAIEKQLGVDLFDRKRPLGLTAAGELFFDGAKKLVEDYRVLLNSVSHYGDRVVGHVQVVAIYSVGLMKMEECLKEFNERYPDARADIRYEHPEQVVNQVLNGSAQIGILSFPEEKRDLVVTQWQEQPLVLVVNPKHRLAGQSSVTVQALEGESFIAFTSDLTICKRMDKWLREQHVAVNVVQQFDNIGQIKEGVGEGSGIAILPLPTVRREVEAGLLVAIPFSNVSWSRPLGIIHRRQRATPTSVQKFIELLTKQSMATPSLPRSMTSPSAEDRDSGSKPDRDGTLPLTQSPLDLAANPNTTATTRNSERASTTATPITSTGSAANANPVAGVAADVSGTTTEPTSQFGNTDSRMREPNSGSPILNQSTPVVNLSADESHAALLTPAVNGSTDEQLNAAHLNAAHMESPREHAAGPSTQRFAGAGLGAVDTIAVPVATAELKRSVKRD